MKDWKAQVKRRHPPEKGEKTMEVEETATSLLHGGRQTHSGPGDSNKNKMDAINTALTDATVGTYMLC